MKTIRFKNNSEINIKNEVADEIADIVDRVAAGDMAGSSIRCARDNEKKILAIVDICEILIIY